MFQVQGYKKFEDKTEHIGQHVFNTKRYQKRMDLSPGWEEVPLCRLNDKLFINITETTIGTFPPSFSVELVHEGEDDVWVDLKLYSLTKLQMENSLSTYENILKKMWNVFNEENCNV